jgi:hypothetical protein
VPAGHHRLPTKARLRAACAPAPPHFPAFALADELLRRQPEDGEILAVPLVKSIGLHDRVPAVGRFLVRDCDARLSLAEANLVRQWIESGFPFHVVRDHVLHNELMIGCLWGGRTDCGIDIVALMRRYFGPVPSAK